jgi:hypothetical protein
MALDRSSYGITAGLTGSLEEQVRSLNMGFYLLQRDMSYSPGKVNFVTSVAIAKGKAVNIFGNKLRYADRATNIPACGVSLAAGAVGQKIPIMLLTGYADSLTGLTPGVSIYTGNAGAMLFVRPTTGMIQGLGYALSATEMLVSVDVP